MDGADLGAAALLVGGEVVADGAMRGPPASARARLGAGLYPDFGFGLCIASIVTTERRATVCGRGSFYCFRSIYLLGDANKLGGDFAAYVWDRRAARAFPCARSYRTVDSLCVWSFGRSFVRLSPSKAVSSRSGPGSPCFSHPAERSGDGRQNTRAQYAWPREPLLGLCSRLGARWRGAGSLPGRGSRGVCQMRGTSALQTVDR